jgi:hypothetical protein
LEAALLTLPTAALPNALVAFAALASSGFMLLLVCFFDCTLVFQGLASSFGSSFASARWLRLT